ncbi:hypothetical protein ACFU98_37170 [Streptomyces sp. NPDC057575]|uniref:hypothetical protein n=1 Tax=unclassified Streptomyces TaxID=2593676 RepID=UPI0036BA4774
MAGPQAVVGTVRVTDWTGHPDSTAKAFPRHYQQDQLADERRHVHGANLAVRADAYRTAGGSSRCPSARTGRWSPPWTPPGFRVKRTSRNSVATSARRNPRAHGGFGDFLRDLDALPG